MFLSIVVPVYNVEAYVKRCLESLAKQDIPKDSYEIIAINDGSTDNSLQIINSLVAEIPNLTVYSQKNAGLSAVRNFGFSVATGDYVWYVDSDDWIENNCLGRILKQLDSHDLLAMGYIDAYDDTSKNVVVDFTDKEKIKSGLDLQELLHSGFNMPAQLYIVKRALLKERGIRFFEGILHEDVEYTPRMLHGIENVAVLDTPVYYFYQRPNSITTTVNPKRAYDLIGVTNLHLISFLEKVDNSREEVAIIDVIAGNVNKAMDMARKFSYDEKKKLRALFSDNRLVFHLMKQSSVRKYAIEGRLFSMFPGASLKLYNLMQLVNTRHLKKRKTSR